MHAFDALLDEIDQRVDPTELDPLRLRVRVSADAVELRGPSSAVVRGVVADLGDGAGLEQLLEVVAGARPVTIDIDSTICETYGLQYMWLPQRNGSDDRSILLSAIVQLPLGPHQD